MKSITQITRSIPEFVRYRTFHSCHADPALKFAVESPSLHSEVPFYSGRIFARQCAVLAEDADKASQSPYGPWLVALRGAMQDLGARRIEAEKRVQRRDALVRGFADFVITTAFGATAVIEVKVVAAGEMPEPRTSHICQLAGYCAALTERDQPPTTAYLAYIELTTPSVRIFRFRDVRQLTRRFNVLLGAAA